MVMDRLEMDRLILQEMLEEHLPLVVLVIKPREHLLPEPHKEIRRTMLLLHRATQIRIIRRNSLLPVGIRRKAMAVSKMYHRNSFHFQIKDNTINE